ncbi:MAG: selenide, water dikinase SelD, partial [Bacteroidetes bacterium]|nr:selenide, water dikinase SelD [Bacteroidota bacterium]
MSFSLLDFSKGGGCGCKIEPGKLREVLSGISQAKDDKILVDFTHGDDASVLDLGEGRLLVQTVDFFLPVVKDPYDFGRIAAANAISDIYAMGARPITALSILGWPVEKIALNVASEVIKGATDICSLAGINISGGHSVETQEPIFGLSVSGLVENAHLKLNNTCRNGDWIYITKPLGLGLLANALKMGMLSEDGYTVFLDLACSLNSVGMDLGKQTQVTAMTDITGFGLLGHLKEMLCMGLGAELELSQIPVIEEAKLIASKMIYPNITTNNYNYIKEMT